MGADRTHARFTAGSPGGVYVGCVLFQKAQMMKALLTEEETVDIIGSVEKQSWNGQKKVQFIVEEIIGCR